MTLAMQLTIMSSNLQRVQASILDVLADTHHGKVSPTLLSPQQLQEELITIRTNLPPLLQLPGSLLELYKLMKVKGGISRSQIVFQIMIPLCNEERYELYKLYSVPTFSNNSIVSVKLCSDIIAITAHRDAYIPITTPILQTCAHMVESKIYLCSNLQFRYNKGAETCACEIQMFNNVSCTNCDLQEIKQNETWT